MAALEIRAASHIGTNVSMSGTKPLCVSGVITTLSAARYASRCESRTKKQRTLSNIGQSIDGAAEQTFMKHSKTAGGIKNFVSSKATYEKWVLSRPAAATFVSALRKMAGLDNLSDNPRKFLRPSETKSSELRVRKIMNVMKNDFLNPYDDKLSKNKLYNLASGRPVTDAESLLSLKQRGLMRVEEFNKRLIKNAEARSDKTPTLEKFCRF